MLTVKLSRRLSAIVDCIPAGTRVVDVGTDHALLPIYLAEHGIVTRVIATDIAEGPARAAAQNVRQAGMDQDISIRCGSGLTTVSVGEVDTCVIAGMGGGTAVQVLTESPHVVDKLSRLIVQPMNSPAEVRRWLRAHRFVIATERVVAEDGRLYVVIAADSAGHPDPAYNPFVPPTWLALAEEFGPNLLLHPSQEALQLVRDTSGQWSHVLASMARAVTASVELRRAELESKLAAAERWLAAVESGEDIRAIIATGI